MLKFLDLDHEFFGLDIGDSAIKMAKLKKCRNSFILDFLKTIELNKGIVQDGEIKKEEELARILKEAMQAIKAKYVVASLPEAKSFLQVVSMPKMKDEELASSVIYEAENNIPLPIEMVYLDFEKISQKEGDGIEILIAACPKQISDAYVSCIKKAGLHPLAFEAESQAVVRALVKKGTRTPLFLINLEKDNQFLLPFRIACVLVRQ
jgi:type IV pilus assembly protein PilM